MSHFYLINFRCVRQTAKNTTISFAMSVCPSARNNSPPNWQILMKFDIWAFFQNLSRKFEFHYNLTTITGTSHEDLYTFMIRSRSVLLRMRNVSDNSCRENQNTHFVFSDFFRKSCRLWDNVGKYGRAGQGTDGNMVHAHCVLDT
jgi:hypothetical protein